MKTQTIAEMIEAGATPEEAQQAYDFFEIVRPGIKVKRNGRVDTTWGDKTTLGLYRTIKRIVEWGKEEAQK